MTAYVYRVFDDDERLIYVGSTINVFNRVKSHKQTWWAHQAARVKAKVYPTIDDARAIEKAAIASENPRWNIQGRWASRFGWSAQDYLDYIDAVTFGTNAETYYNRIHLARVRQELKARHGVEVAC